MNRRSFLSLLGLAPLAGLLRGMRPPPIDRPWPLDGRSDFRNISFKDACRTRIFVDGVQAGLVVAASEHYVLEYPDLRGLLELKKAEHVRKAKREPPTSSELELGELFDQLKAAAPPRRRHRGSLRIRRGKVMVELPKDAVLSLEVRRGVGRWVRLV